MKSYVLAIAGVLVGFGIGYNIEPAPASQPSLTEYLSAPVAQTVYLHGRHCEEDEVIVGVGQYDGEAWNAYACQARDDL